MSTILVFFAVFWFESYPLLCDQGDPKCSTLLCSHIHMYTILYVAVLYMAGTNSASTTTVYNIKAKLLRRYHIVRERERETDMWRGGREMNLSFYKVLWHGLVEPAGMASKMKVNITDSAWLVLLVLVLLLHQHWVSQKLDGSLVLMWRSVTQTPRIEMTGRCTHGTHRLNQHHMALTRLLYGCYSLAQLDRSVLVLLWLCSL